MYLIGLMSQLKIVLIMTNCTRFIQCSTWYETALLKATSLDKIKQLMKAWLPLRADLVMHNTYLPHQSREELRCGCAVMLIQHICINLRCILVNRKTLSLVLDMMWWWSYVRIYQENIIMSIVTTCLHLFSYWRTCWLVKHTAMGQYEWIRSIFQRVFINLVEWSVVLTNHTRMAAQTWWPLFGKTIEL